MTESRHRGDFEVGGRDKVNRDRSMFEDRPSDNNNKRQTGEFQGREKPARRERNRNRMNKDTKKNPMAKASGQAHTSQQHASDNNNNINNRYLIHIEIYQMM